MAQHWIYKDLQAFSPSHLAHRQTHSNWVW
jgi:hypothetical protein